MNEAEYRSPSVDWDKVTSAKRTAIGPVAGKAGSRWQPPRTVVARRAIVEAAAAARRDRSGALADIKALTPLPRLSQSQLAPSRTQAEPVGIRPLRLRATPAAATER